VSRSEALPGAREASSDLTADSPAPSNALDRLDALLARVVALDGSDLHLTAGIQPMVRLRGELAPLTGWPPLTPGDVETIARGILTPAQWTAFGDEQELDFAHGVTGVGRFRANLYRQRGSVGAAFRVIPRTILDLDRLGLPPVVSSLAHLQRGLVLVTGPTGSGKSTTLASLIDLANRTRTGHILTIEDPIEYVHQHGHCIINQREVGVDTAGFETALKHALRQDPDIILVGELRDLETTAVAVTAAETGHLVLATLHTRSAATTVERLIDIFPPSQQQQIRTQLSGCLEAVVAQALAPTSDGLGRTAICEVMLATPAIRNLIREAKVHQITNAIQSSGELGMITFDQHLADRLLEGRISRTTAFELAHQPDELRRIARL
jgi:twitching motility protein PilT